MAGMVLKPLWCQLVPRAKSFVITSRLLCKSGCTDTSYQVTEGSKATLCLYTVVANCVSENSSGGDDMQTQSCCSPKNLYMFSQAPKKVMPLRGR